MGGLLPKASKPTPPPLIPAPVPIPDAQDPLKKLDVQKKLAKRISASGRESTFLTKSDKLGGA